MPRLAALLAAAGTLAVLTTPLPPAHAETPAETATRDRGEPVQPAPPTPRVELVGGGSRALPTFVHAGQRFVLGEPGSRYAIHVVNPTPERIEAVISVDGLDAIDGKPASVAKRGYVIPPFGDLTVDGWRTSLERVAAFRFSSVSGSYAAQTGDARNVGVVGVAFFREPAPVVWRAPATSAGRSSAAESAPAPSPPAASKDAARPGLGTGFGESRESPVVETTFVRASSVPSALSTLRYDDRGGLVARGILPRIDPRQAELERRDRAEPFQDVRFAQPPR